MSIVNQFSYFSRRGQILNAFATLSGLLLPCVNGVAHETPTLTSGAPTKFSATEQFPKSFSSPWPLQGILCEPVFENSEPPEFSIYNEPTSISLLDWLQKQPAAEISARFNSVIDHAQRKAIEQRNELDTLKTLSNDLINKFQDFERENLKRARANGWNTFEQFAKSASFKNSFQNKNQLKLWKEKESAYTNEATAIAKRIIALGLPVVSTGAGAQIKATPMQTWNALRSTAVIARESQLSGLIYGILNTKDAIVDKGTRAPLPVQKIDKNKDPFAPAEFTLPSGQSVPLTNEFSFGSGPTGKWLVASAENGRFYTRNAADPGSKYEALCGSQKSQSSGDLAQIVINRILDTGRIEMTREECEAIKKAAHDEKIEYDDDLKLGGYIETKIRKTVAGGAMAAGVLVKVPESFKHPSVDPTDLKAGEQPPVFEKLQKYSKNKTEEATRKLKEFPILLEKWKAREPDSFTKEDYDQIARDFQPYESDPFAWDPEDGIPAMVKKVGKYIEWFQVDLEVHTNELQALEADEIPTSLFGVAGILYIQKYNSAGDVELIPAVVKEMGKNIGDPSTYSPISAAAFTIAAGNFGEHQYDFAKNGQPGNLASNLQYLYDLISCDKAKSSKK